MAEPKPYYGISKLSDRAKKRKEVAKERAQAKKDYQNKKSSSTAVSGTMKGKQVDTTISPNMSGIKKSERGQALFKNVKVPYKPTPKIEGNIASRVDNSDNTRIGPNMNQVNKQDAKSTLTKKEMTMMEKAKDIIGVGREATEKEKMGRALQDNARKSMGMKKGGKVYSKDGCAVRGKTKGKLY
jgi:hypothetical protein